MEWTKEDTQALLEFKNSVDSDDVKVKEQIKKVLLNNRFIVHVLNNKKLEDNDAEPEDYFGENIKPFYMVPDTQTEVANYICYEVGYQEVNKYNNSLKPLKITFHILCYQDNIIDEETKIARHDLLAALLQDQFNFTNYIGGGRLRLVYDMPSTTDSKYATRTLIFEQFTDNNLVKTKNGVSKYSNKEITVLGES